ncbi:monocarboxylate transporter 12-like [Ixodes scapularis]|uniref:monocarboxylate transporter 12-like n=1 Tax=Ixodes scapularis TaxID=6945 RepID=UPI001C394186|nr:monocarboxylate transporter 12-like [Ixodes scapularis]
MYSYGTLCAGLVAGIMLQYFDGRTMIMAATLSASLSAIACFVWDNLVSYHVFVGLIFGAAAGTAICTNVVVLNGYFVRRKASATGLNYAGASLGSMFFPPLLANLNDWYGLRGTMLILGAMVLNAMVGALVLRSLPPCRASDGTELTTSLDSLGYLFTDPMVPNAPLQSTVCRRLENSGKEGPAPFLWQPLFYVLLFTGAVYGFVFSSYYLTVVDHISSVCHVTNEWASLSVAAMSVGDLASRLVSGYITDRECITREQLLVINFGSLGVCYVLLTFLTGVSDAVVLALVFGLNAGGPIISLPVLLAEHCGNRHLPITFGIHRFIMGV